MGEEGGEMPEELPAEEAPPAEEAVGEEAAGGEEAGGGEEVAGGEEGGGEEVGVEEIAGGEEKPPPEEETIPVYTEGEFDASTAAISVTLAISLFVTGFLLAYFCCWLCDEIRWMWTGQKQQIKKVKLGARDSAGVKIRKSLKGGKKVRAKTEEKELGPPPPAEAEQVGEALPEPAEPAEPEETPPPPPTEAEQPISEAEKSPEQT